jgi:superfamily I DNA/RNA helicase
MTKLLAKHAKLTECSTTQLYPPLNDTLADRPKIIEHDAFTNSSQRKRFSLNSEQQFAFQQDLVLAAEDKHPHPYNLRLIHGLAGSGKSMLLLHRAKRLDELYPEKKTLILTHNQAVHHYLKAQYKHLFKQQNNNCQPFMEWCLQQCKWTGRFVAEEDVMEIITQIVTKHFKNSRLTKQLFLREIGFIKDRLIFTEIDYLRVDRSKQAYYFSAEMRVNLWLALLEFDAELRARHLLLWSELPRLLWRDMQAGTIQIEQYDHILIDEAQYFAPIWFEIIKKAIKPTIGQLFMVADPDQGFLNRILNWKETGLDLRNRTFRLQRNYRSNPLILKVADTFRYNHSPNKTHHMLSSNMNANLSSTEHTPPTLLHFHHEKDETNYLISEVNKLLQQGTPPQDILILDAANSSARPLLRTIKQSFNQSACSLTEPHWDKNVLRVCDLASATGLESPTVFIIGLQALFEQKNKIQLTEREYHTLALENTRKLYMGMTRACKKLVLLLTADIIPNSLQIKEMDIPMIS